MDADDTHREADSNAARLDGRRLRVLAHPLRARLLSSLRAYGPATAADLARRLETHTGATSYHLRQLAEVGLIEEETGRGTARQRWWRATHEFTTWNDATFTDDPDDRAAVDWLLGHHLRVTTGWREDWLASRTEWPSEWQDAADTSDVQLRLTADQLKRLHEDLLEVVHRYREAGPDSEEHAETVTVLLDTFPLPEPRL